MVDELVESTQTSPVAASPQYTRLMVMAPMARAWRRKPRPGAPGFGLARDFPGRASSAVSAASTARATPFARNRECIATSLECDRTEGTPARHRRRAEVPSGSEGDLETEPQTARGPVEVVERSEERRVGKECRSRWS